MVELLSQPPPAEAIARMAAIEGVPRDHVLPFAGSSDPLHRAVLAFTSPSRPLVTAEPGYEAPEGAARFVKAKVIKVPLRKDYSHDPKGMATAHPRAGLIFICNGSLWCFGVAVLAARTADRVRRSGQALLWINRALGGMFVYLGARIALLQAR